MNAALDAGRLDALRRRLDARAVELRAELDAVRAELAEVPSKVPHNQVEDLGERGEQRFREALRHAETERDQAELRDVADSLASMERGDYGACTDCGRDIAPERLEAQPSSRRCIACQERHERAHGTGTGTGTGIPPVI